MAEIFKFKKNPRPTGLGRIARPNADTTIKMGGKDCGMIAGPSRFSTDHWQVRMTVADAPTEDKPCAWRWVFFKEKHATEDEARAWVKRHADALVKTFDIFGREP